MRRNRKVIASKCRSSLVISPSNKARMAAYWSVGREDMQIPWVNPAGEGLRPSEILRKQRPSSHHSGTSDHACDCGTGCPQHSQFPYAFQPHLSLMHGGPKRMSSPTSRVLSVHLHPKSKQETGRGMDRMPTTVQIQRLRSLKRNSQRVSCNSSDDYGFLRPKTRSKSLVEANSVIFQLDEKAPSSQSKHNANATSDFEDEDDENFNSAGSFRRNSGVPGSGLSTSKRASNLRRRKACYNKDKRSEGRSRSLTQIHTLEANVGKKLDMDCRSEPGHQNDQVLLVPPPTENNVGTPKSPLTQSKKGKNRFFSASTEDTTYGGGTTNSNLSPAGPNSSSQDGPQNNATTSSPTAPGSAGSAPVSAAAKKRSLLSLSSPKYYQRQSRHPSGLISHEGSLKVKNPSTKQHRWSSLFTSSVKESSKMDTLADHLDSYEKYGIPRPNAILCDNDELESINTLEEDWRLIVDHWEDLSYRRKQQQSAIFELIESECIYLKTLELLTDLFLGCLYQLQSANILNEIDRDKIFSNIPEIYKANKTLWLECIFPMVKKARETNLPFQPSELHSGFLQFAEICKPYIQYCLEQPLSQDYCRSNDQRNPLFKVYLAWCEARPDCGRERLKDLLVRPLQRMTKYSLLLGAILKYTDEQEERLCMEEMIMCVERFVNSVNASLRNQQESERLQGIMDKMEVYDVVDTKDEELELVIKSHSRLNLFEPMPGCGSVKRWLIFESDMRLRDSFTSKVDVHCFLFTDMLLICKSANRQGDKLKIIRQPYMVDKLIPREFNKDPCAFGLVYVNEYGTAIAALALHGRDNKLVKQWTEHLKKATKLYVEAKAKADENLEFPALIADLPDVDAGIELEDEENSTGLIYMPPQSPRGLSSRASQMSSLLHSHSGSIEMNEMSQISSRARSFEQELRGSSLSSEEGTGNDPSSTGATCNLSSARSLSVETGPLRPPSPRHDRRRLFISKSPSPNSLSVQIPVPNLLGQSLPNLNASPPQPHPHEVSLTVPKSTLSPTHRGVSYPPPSPRGLRRSQISIANPPLIKSKHIGGSPERSPVTPTTTVEIKDPIPPSNDASPSMSVLPEDCFGRPKSPTSPRKPQLPVLVSESVVQILHCNPESDPEGDLGESCNLAMARRLARNERMDTKRYYTAGVIEDLKKENSREKDSAITKRLSWNHGPQMPPEQNKLAADANRKFFSSDSSMNSIRSISSSGISSISSLSHYNSDIESTREGVEESGTVGPRGSPVSPSASRQRPDVLIAVSEPEERERRKGVIEPPPARRVSLSPATQRRLMALKHFAERDSHPTEEDVEFDSLAYERATQKIPQLKSDCSEEASQSKDPGSNKPKDLLNLLLTDGSLESSDV